MRHLGRVGSIQMGYHCELIHSSNIVMNSFTLILIYFIGNGFTVAMLTFYSEHARLLEGGGN